MTIDEKIAEVLRKLAQYSIRRAIFIPDLHTESDWSVDDWRQIMKILELEGYAETIYSSGLGYMTVTELGKRVGLHDLFEEIQAERKAEQTKRINKEKAEKRNVRFNQIITALSVISVALIGTWSNLLNQDVKEIKGSMDSVRVEMRRLRKAVELMGSKSEKSTRLPESRLQSTSDSSRPARPIQKESVSSKVGK